MPAALALTLAFALAATSGQAAAQEKLRVVTTSTDLKSLVEAVGAERVEVESLTSPSQDPHVFEVKPAQIVRLRQAALVVRVGLDHEPWFSRIKLKQATVLDAAQGVRLLQTETPRLRAARKAHVHAFGNPHYWLDPLNARPITAAIVEALTRLSPADKPRFGENREAFLKKLDLGIERWTAALAPFRGVKVVVIHDSWAYFAERFGLDIAAAAEPTPGVPPSPAELAALYTRMRESGVRIVIAEPYSNPALVRQIVEKSGASAVTLLASVGAEPAAADYLSLFDVNVKRLASSLKEK